MVFINPDVDRILLAIFIILFFILVRKLFRKIVIGFLEKFALKTASSIDDEIIKVLKNPIDLLFLNIGFKIASKFLTLPSKIEIFVDKIIESLFIYILFLAIYKIMPPLSNIIINTSRKMQGKALGRDLANLITKAIQVVIIAIALITLLQEWGYNITGFLASLGLVGMAIALAAKDTVANLFGSLVIFSDKPFKIGDWIYTNSAEGVVEEVGIRSTKIRTFAQALVSVPNAVLANSSILNWSRMGKRRIKIKLGLTYSTTSIQMETIIKQIRELLCKEDTIHQETIHIYFTDFDNSSLGIFCYFFTKTTAWGTYMEVRQDINLKIMRIVEQNKASFAFPSQSIYIEQNNTEQI